MFNVLFVFTCIWIYIVRRFSGPLEVEACRPTLAFPSPPIFSSLADSPNPKREDLPPLTASWHPARTLQTGLGRRQHHHFPLLVFASLFYTFKCSPKSIANPLQNQCRKRLEHISNKYGNTQCRIPTNRALARARYAFSHNRPNSNNAKLVPKKCPAEILKSS